MIEHLKDDIAVLTVLRDLIAPGGFLVLTFPAHPALWSYFDDYSHRQRRYTSEELSKKLKAAGYEIKYLTPYMLPLIWLGRKLTTIVRSPSNRSSTKLAEADLRVTPIINRLFFWLLVWESLTIARRGRLPFGASLIAAVVPISEPSRS